MSLCGTMIFVARRFGFSMWLMVWLAAEKDPVDHPLWPDELGVTERNFNIKGRAACGLPCPLCGCPLANLP